MMGIYSVDPASLGYELVAPTFSKVTLHLQAPYTGNAFVIESPASETSKPYIQSVQWNGKSHTQNWISFADIRQGGTLHVDVGPRPNPAWGSADKDAPPSLSNER